ncbi:MAG TPA: DUF475 domain-containing protein [Saprospiraceae bacterium]|nr:DUF475 domain-containing protein [Saprospiraceae bacterium]
MDISADVLVIVNLILIESLLSIDNAAVLATMVMDLPKDQRPKALRYGIIGAYFFRGIALVFASLLVKIWWLKVIGGLYLLYLCIDYFWVKEKKRKEKRGKGKNSFLKIYLIEPVHHFFNPIKKSINKRIKGLGRFWYTVILIEIMDLAFSVDNVFAAVAFTDKLYLICIGVFIGILAMRFVAQYFVVLMERFAFLQNIAFIVIGLLGLKLFSSLLCHFDIDILRVCNWLGTEQSEWILSLICLLVFFVPVGTSLIFGYPQRNNKSEPKTK